MAFSHSKYTTISGSCFADVGRDQIRVRIGSIVNNNFSLFGPRQTPLPVHHLSEVLALPTPAPEAASQRSALVLGCYPRDGISAVDINTGLIVQIVQLLIGPEGKQSSDRHRHLRLELEGLSELLVLTAAAIQEYRLINALTPEVDRCRVILEELLDRVIGTRRGLSWTTIWSLWNPIWWSRWDGDELESLRTKLSESRESFRGFLMALNSVTWMELRNDLRIGNISLKEFDALLRQRLPSLRHIQLENVSVVDHLGRNMPVPTMFCSTWKDLHHIITGYCKDRIGNQYVERGEYHIISAEDNKRIGRMELAKEMKPGTIFEMSIILDELTPAVYGECPRCHHVNLNITESNGWIECRQCSGQFQLEQVDKSPSDDTSNSQAHSFNEVFSPATSRAGQHHTTRKDEASFFRRINVIRPFYSLKRTLRSPKITDVMIPRREWLIARRERLFVCDVSGCGRTFNARHNLRYHIKGHNWVVRRRAAA